ncbi:hypothetical protein GGU10DRAFT_331799 [Lentinula aff. detonsa]|uniref:Uncharacterized protein n=1 Tax=Lentinula aff. detonsa TaxID=2804958 RepID=A0AA38NML4_9AGAR|nr:hypothetical protein GGU10DRAFT_331799 [Lentinula aff. detonsa]
MRKGARDPLDPKNIIKTKRVPKPKELGMPVPETEKQARGNNDDPENEEIPKPPKKKTRTEVVDSEHEIKSWRPLNRESVVQLQLISHTFTNLFGYHRKANASQTRFVKDTTTVWRHLESQHAGEYKKWCSENGFQKKLLQSTLDGNMVKVKPKVPVIPYSHANFLQAMLEWMIATDQPLWALQHPAYQNMIHVASRAMTTIQIPNRKVTWQEIMNMFWKFIEDTKGCFNSQQVTLRVQPPISHAGK